MIPLSLLDPLISAKSKTPVYASKAPSSQPNSPTCRTFEFKLEEQLKLSEDTPYVQDVKIWFATPDYYYTLRERPVRSGQLVTIVPMMWLSSEPKCFSLIFRATTDTAFERIGYVGLIVGTFDSCRETNSREEETVSKWKTMEHFVASLPICQVTII
jgi:hypothetical protein